MKLALVNGERREAAKGLVGICIGCGKPMTPVCGPKKINHWRHKVDCECDRWWENETEWHRGWKGFFPKDWQEVRHRDEASGEWHIADVKTDSGNILEFQHSYLDPLERESRNKFYGESLIWVVDGTLRKKDFGNFEEIMTYAKPVLSEFSILKLPPFLDKCALLTDWSECKVPVFFDFGLEDQLWFLLPKTEKQEQYILPYSKQKLVSLSSGNLGEKDFSELVTFIKTKIFLYENPDFLKLLNAKRMQSKSAAIPQRRIVLPRMSLQDLNYLMRPPRRQFRKYRK